MASGLFSESRFLVAVASSPGLKSASRLLFTLGAGLLRIGVQVPLSTLEEFSAPPREGWLGLGTSEYLTIAVEGLECANVMNVPMLEACSDNCGSCRI